MKKTKMTFYKALSLIFLFLSTATIALKARSILNCTIQYPKNIKLSKISTLPIVYYTGNRVPTHIHDGGISKVTFEIPKGDKQNRFYVLIVQDIAWNMKDALDKESSSNTIDYLKVPKDTIYKFYTLDLVEDVSLDQSLDLLAEFQNKQPTYHWEIAESTLPENGQIPDATIIVQYFPQAVKTLKGGSHLELPTIVLDNSMIELFGTVEKLQEESIKLQLSSLDSNTIHAPTHKEIKTEQSRLLIVHAMT